MAPSIMVRCVPSDIVAGVIKRCCVFLRVKVCVDIMTLYACVVSDVPLGKIELQQNNCFLMR